MPKTDVGAGCAIVVFNKNHEFYMLKRPMHLSHHPGVYCLPGGWIEKNEATLDAGRREVKEEFGVSVKAIKVVGLSDNIIPSENHHTISALMVAMLADGETPINAEPDKSDECICLPFSRFYDIPRPIFCDYAANMSMLEIEKFLEENC